MRRSGLPRSCPSISGTVMTPVDSSGRLSCPLTSADAVTVAEVSGRAIVLSSSAASDVSWLLRRFARASKGHPVSKPMRPLTSALKVGSPTSNRTARSALLAVNSTGRARDRRWRRRQQPSRTFPSAVWASRRHRIRLRRHRGVEPPPRPAPTTGESWRHSESALTPRASPHVRRSACAPGGGRCRLRAGAIRRHDSGEGRSRSGCLARR